MPSALLRIGLLAISLRLPAQRYSFKPYGLEQGLGNLTVRSLLQDRTGFLWVGTYNGLFRYDGEGSWLLAEDDPVNQRVAVGLLAKAGHTVVVAQHGREVLRILEREPDLDLVLMDVQMPELDGLEATKLIREREKATGGHVPILAMTASAMKGDREHCLAAGMDGYVSKPVQPQALREAIASLLQPVPVLYWQPVAETAP
jgi:CheY-like chemotaxis protein